MADNKTSHTDEGLQDNEQIEQAILALQQQPSQEMLAHALTVLRDHGVQEVVLGFFPRWEKGLKCGARLFQSLRLQPRARRHLVLGIGWDRVGSPRRELGVRDWAEDWHEWLLGA